MRTMRLLFLVVLLCSEQDQGGEVQANVDTGKTLNAKSGHRWVSG